MVNVLTIKTAIIDLLKNNNTQTATYNLSSGLERKVAKITGSNAEKQPVLKIHYPAVFVEVKASRDEHYLMGNINNRAVEIDIDVVSVVDHGISLKNAREESDDELIMLTQNIQDLLRNNIKLSNTVDECLISETNYEAEYANDAYNSQSRMSLLIKKRG